MEGGFKRQRVFGASGEGGGDSSSGNGASSAEGGLAVQPEAMRPAADGGASSGYEAMDTSPPAPHQPPPPPALQLGASMAAVAMAAAAAAAAADTAMAAQIARESSAAASETVPPASLPTAGALADSKQAPPSIHAFLESPELYDASAEILHQASNAEGDTALYLAAKVGNEAAVRALLAVRDKTDCDKQNHKGITPLSIAAHKGKVEVVRLLLAQRPMPAVNRASNNGSTPLIQASHFGHVDVVDLLVAAGSAVDLANKKGTTALMRATQEGNEAVVRRLVAAGADVNVRNNERMNALMLGSQRGHANIVKALIDHRAEIDGQTAQGSTALMLACKRGHLDVVRVLLTAGAEMHGQDSRGRTARDTAERRRHAKIIELLSGSAQNRLMQNESRVERSLLLSWLYKRHSSGDPLLALPAVADDLAVAASPSLAMLRKVFDLNDEVFERIVQFMPLPRLWRTELQRLQRRCNTNATEAVNGAMRMIDEIFTDLVLMRQQGPAAQQGHLVRIRDDAALRERLLSAEEQLGVPMPEKFLGTVLEQFDVQSIVMRFKPEDVKFDPSVAQKVVNTAGQLHHWYECRESCTPYHFAEQPQLLCGGASGGGGAGAGGADGVNAGDALNGANTEDESSDGEMDN